MVASTVHRVPFHHHTIVGLCAVALSNVVGAACGAHAYAGLTKMTSEIRHPDQHNVDYTASSKPPSRGRAEVWSSHPVPQTDTSSSPASCADTARKQATPHSANVQTTPPIAAYHAPASTAQQPASRQASQPATKTPQPDSITLQNGSQQSWALGACQPCASKLRQVSVLQLHAASLSCVVVLCWASRRAAHPHSNRRAPERAAAQNRAAMRPWAPELQPQFVVLLNTNILAGRQTDMQQQQLPLPHVNAARLHQSAAKATSAAAICPDTSVMQQAVIPSTAAGVQSLLLLAQSVQQQVQHASSAHRGRPVLNSTAATGPQQPTKTERPQP